MADPRTLPTDYATEHEKRVFSVGDPGVEVLRGEVAALKHFNDPFKVPSKYLAWRAHEAKAPFWDPDWTEAQQRRAIDALWEIHRTAGTEPAVRLALSLLNINAEIVEWFEKVPEGVPGTFDIIGEVNGTDLFSDKIWRLAFAAIDSSKPLSRHYTLRMLATKNAEVFAGVAPMIRMTIVAAPLEVAPPVVTATARAGVAPFTRLLITARPKEV